MELHLNLKDESSVIQIREGVYLFKDDPSVLPFKHPIEGFEVDFKGHTIKFGSLFRDRICGELKYKCKFTDHNLYVIVDFKEGGWL